MDGAEEGRRWRKKRRGRMGRKKKWGWGGEKIMSIDHKQRWRKSNGSRTAGGCSQKPNE